MTFNDNQVGILALRVPILPHTYSMDDIICIFNREKQTQFILVTDTQDNIIGYISRNIYTYFIHFIDSLDSVVPLDSITMNTNYTVISSYTTIYEVLQMLYSNNCNTSDGICLIYHDAVLLGIVSIEMLLIHQNRIYNERLNKIIMMQKFWISKNISSCLPVEMYYYNMPARNISGDFYCAQKLDTHLYLFGVFDVSGKGIESGILHPILSTFFTMIKERICDAQAIEISSIVSLLNMICIEQTDSNLFITGTLCFLDMKQKELSYYNFANPQAVISINDNTTVYTKQWKLISPPLGVIPSEIFQPRCKKIKIIRQVRILLYTDGVSEAHANDSIFYSNERVIEICQNNFTIASKHLFILLKNDIVDFHNNNMNSLHDDITMMLIDFTNIL